MSLFKNVKSKGRSLVDSYLCESRAQKKGANLEIIEM